MHTPLFISSGAYGVDFSEDTDALEEGVHRVAKGLLEHGVTSFCPTVITSPKELYDKVRSSSTKQNYSSKF